MVLAQEVMSFGRTLKRHGPNFITGTVSNKEVASKITSDICGILSLGDKSELGSRKQRVVTSGSRSYG